MYLAQPIANYVKFLRGTPNAYSNLAQKDADTLYFISEKDADHGLLYLGSKLINTGGGSTSTLTSVGMKDLTDVNLGSSIANGSVLAYDSSTKKWVAKTASSTGSGSVDIMMGATDDDDGLSGLVPVPMAGDNAKFLKGDGTWSNPVPESLLTLLGDDAGSSAREIAEDVISKWSKGNPTDATSLNVRLTAVETTINSLGDNYVTKTVYAAEVGDLNQLLHNVDSDATLVEEINNINERLEWQEMTT